MHCVANLLLITMTGLSVEKLKVDYYINQSKLQTVVNAKNETQATITKKQITSGWVIGELLLCLIFSSPRSGKEYNV